MAGPHIEVSLRVGSFAEDTFRVVGLTGEEKLSELYAFHVDVVAPDATVEVETLAVGRDAALTLRVGERERRITGIVGHTELCGHRLLGDRLGARYRIDVVPHAHLMTLRRTSRVFQDMRLPEILEEVFLPYFLPVRFALKEEYPVRRYTTQLEESDWTFVRRLAAEYGLFFFFEPPGVEAAAVDALRGVVDAARGALGALADFGPLADLLGPPEAREVLVFTDSPIGYPPLRSDPRDNLVDAALEQLRRAGASAAGQALGALGGAAGGALGGAAGAAAGGALGEALGGALGGALAADPEATTLRYRDPAHALEHPDERVVTELVRSRALRPKTAVFGDHDFRSPRALFVQSAAAAEAGGDPWTKIATALRDGPLGALGDAAGAAAAGALSGLAGGVAGALQDAAAAALPPEARRMRDLLAHHQPMEIYAHHGSPLFPNDEQDRREAKRLLEEARKDADTAAGKSVCPWLSAGHWFRLVDHDVERLNRTWVPVAVTHVLRDDAGQHVYENALRCVPADVPYPAEGPGPRKVHVCHTATVIGTEPVHTQEHGMVQVRFHWDRENGRSGHRSTCWLRVMQAWAGAGWGAQFLPRVGTEVVVTFEGGNPDKPIVLGGVHNAENPPPFPLPRDRNKSGFRTRSIPGSEGENELSFDDTRNAEKILLHAERDLDIEVEHDRVTQVQHEDRLHVAGDRRVRVDGATHEHHTGRREVVVHGGQSVTVHGQHTTSTLGDEVVRVSGTRRIQVDGAAVETHRGRYQLAAQSDVVQRVQGNFVRLVGSEDGKRSYTTRVEGDLRMSSSDVLELSSDKEIVLRCGDSVLRLSPDQATLKSKKVVLEVKDVVATLGDGDFRVFCDGGNTQVVAEKVLLKASGASVGLSSEASVDGSRVLLNSPENASDKVEPASTERTVVVLTDQEGEPIPDQPFRVVLGDGREITGTTDRDGRATLDLEEAGTIVFPGLRGVQNA